MNILLGLPTAAPNTAAKIWQVATSVAHNGIASAEKVYGALNQFCAGIYFFIVYFLLLILLSGFETDFLSSGSLMLLPSKSGVDLSTVVQREGDLLIILPGVAHQGGGVVCIYNN